MAFLLNFNGKALFFIKKTLTETFHQSISISLTVIYLQAYRQTVFGNITNYTKKRGRLNLLDSLLSVLIQNVR